MIKSKTRGVAKEKPEKVAAREMREKNVKALKEKANNYWREGNDNEKTDPSLSVAMYRKAADLDHARAQARLALLLWCGGLDGIRQDREEALKWTRAALEKPPGALAASQLACLRHLARLRVDDARAQAVEAQREAFEEAVAVELQGLQNSQPARAVPPPPPPPPQGGMPSRNALSPGAARSPPPPPPPPKSSKINAMRPRDVSLGYLAPPANDVMTSPASISTPWSPKAGSAALNKAAAITAAAPAAAPSIQAKVARPAIRRPPPSSAQRPLAPPADGEPTS